MESEALSARFSQQVLAEFQATIPLDSQAATKVAEALAVLGPE